MAGVHRAAGMEHLDYPVADHPAALAVVQEKETLKFF
jgi:hypothetical protein